MRAAVVAALLLAGCASFISSSTSVAHSADSPWDGQSHGSAECGDEVQLSGAVNRTAGAVSIVVQDGDGEEVLRVLLERSTDVKRDLSGAAGTWELHAAGVGFEGSFRLKLEC